MAFVINKQLVTSLCSRAAAADHGASLSQAAAPRRCSPPWAGCAATAPGLSLLLPWFSRAMFSSQQGTQDRRDRDSSAWDGLVPPPPGQQAEGLTASPGTAPPGLERERSPGLCCGRAVRRGAPRREGCGVGTAAAMARGPPGSGLGLAALPVPQLPMCMHTHTLSHACTHKHACTLFLPASGICPSPWKRW